MVFFGNGFLFANWAARIPQVRAELGVTPGVLGLMLGCLAVGSGIGTPLSGLIVARLGEIRTVGVMAVVAAAGMAVAAVGVLAGTAGRGGRRRGHGRRGRAGDRASAGGGRGGRGRGAGRGAPVPARYPRTGPGWPVGRRAGFQSAGTPPRYRPIRDEVTPGHQ
jgi:hypothetical protein